MMKSYWKKTFTLSAVLAFPWSLGAVLPVTDGLVLHLNPAGIQSSDGTVTAWNDASGNNNHALAPTAPAVGLPALAAGAVNGLDAVQYDGGQLLQVPGNPADFDFNTWTWFVVMNPDVTNLRSVFMNRYTTATYNDANVGNVATRNLAWGTQVDANNVRTASRNNTGGVRSAPVNYAEDFGDVFFIVEGSWDGGAEEIVTVLNGGPSVSNDLTGLTFGGHQRLSIGGVAGGATGSEILEQGYIGMVAEIIAFNRILSFEERQEVGLYLQDAYNIDGSYIPEPSTYALILGLAVGLGLVIRRGRRG